MEEERKERLKEVRGIKEGRKGGKEKERKERMKEGGKEGRIKEEGRMW